MSRDAAIRHYFHNDPAGNVHVESVLSRERRRRHVHTVSEFVRWCALVLEDSLVAVNLEFCDCDLLPGQALEGNGGIWNSPQFAKHKECISHE
jgi:hypothetical protein